MKISSVKALHCDGGWRPWTFVRIETDDGLVGWGECSDNRSPYGIAGCVKDLEHLLLGQDPRPVELIYWDLLRATRQNLGGVTHKAIAGIELALWDIKAKALGIPVYELFGGPLRDRMRLYWSHCGTTRARMSDMLGTPPLRTYDDIVALGKEVVARGFTALKTNIVIPGDPANCYFPGFSAGINSTDGVANIEVLDAIEKLIGAFRDGVGPKVGLCLDLNYNFRTDGVIRIGKLLEQFKMQWMEYDNWDPQALLQIKQSTATPLASCESLVSTRQYRPFLELHAMDVAIIDVPWNGFSQGVQIGRMAEAYETNIAPHNYYSHLADLHSLHLCAVLPNVRIMEIDIDDVPWKKDLVTVAPDIRDGHVFLPKGPGWGADINEEVLREHPWPPPGKGPQLFYGMSSKDMNQRPGGEGNPFATFALLCAHCVVGSPFIFATGPWCMPIAWHHARPSAHHPPVTPRRRSPPETVDVAAISRHSIPTNENRMASRRPPWVTGTAHSLRAKIAAVLSSSRATRREGATLVSARELGASA